MKYLILAALFVVCYLVGSMNSAIIVTYLLKRKDIRKYGSFNAGLTNVYRCFGSACAVCTILADFLKGAAVVFGTRLILMLPIFDDFKLDALSVCLISTLFAVIGHCFPIFYGFKGGKGILLAAICMLLTDPMVFLLELIMFVILVAATRYISVGSLAACIGYPLYTMIWQAFANRFLGMHFENIALHGLLILPMFFLCYFRHLSNIRHLFSGEEKKFSFHKKGENE